MFKKLLFSFLVVFLCLNVSAQLDTIHYVPPLHARLNADVEQHYIYLSTPEPVAFIVTLTDGAGNVMATPTISQDSPFRYFIGSGQVPGTEILVPYDSVGVVLTESGIIASALSSFYCNLRITDDVQAGSSTGKGKAAFGQLFYVGSIPTIVENARRNFVTSVMATEDATVVVVSGYNTGVVFENGAGANNTDDTRTITLDRGESYIFTGFTNTVANRTGFVGARIASDKDIVVTTGNMCGSYTSGGQDIGIDQIVPINRLGDEYVLLRGNGSNDMEQPLVVAAHDNTEIFVNGSLTAITTLTSAGDYFPIPEANYTGGLHENMIVTGSENFYMYQPIGGDVSDATTGLNFIPPASCFLPNSVDLIPDVDEIGPDSYSGSVTLFTASGATVLINGLAVGAAFGPQVVDGSGGDWVTYNITGLSGDIEITSTGAMAAGFFGFNGFAGFAGYFSGFASLPNLNLASSNEVGGITCLPADSLFLQDPFDTYEWFLDDLSIPGEDGPSYNPDAEGEYFVVLSKAACIDTSARLFVYDCSTLLPIELLSFSAEPMNNEFVELTWTTASEIDNDYFVVERSADGVHWEPVLTEQGAGNSSAIINYSGIDRFPIPGISYYRLKQVDFNGQFSYADPVSVVIENFNIISVYPNPSTGITTLYLSSQSKGQIQYLIYSVEGKLIQRTLHEINKGDNKIELDLSQVANGIYHLALLSNDSVLHNQKIIISH